MINVPINKLEFIRGKDIQLNEKYQFDLLKLSTISSVRDSTRAASDVVKMGDKPKLSGLLYPLMQALDSYIGELIRYDKSSPGGKKSGVVIFDKFKDGRRQEDFERKIDYQHLNFLGMGELGNFMKMDVYHFGPFTLEHLIPLEEFIEEEPTKRGISVFGVIEGGRK